MVKKEDILDEGQIYEVGFHLLPNISEDELAQTVSKLRDSITANGGVIFAEEFPKMRDLAYEIKKHVETKYLRFNKAFFGWFKFESMPEAIAKVKEEFEINKNVLRFLIIKTVRENTMHTPKVVISKNNDNEEGKLNNQTEVQEKGEISEEEIDKSIDELLVDEKLEN